MGEIPVFHVPDDGPARAAIMFRVGRGDEALPSAGITHLVEHLALFPFGQRAFDYNGFVDPIRSMFVASGTPEELRDFLRDVCGNLTNLPLDRLATEQRVLRDESSRRSVGPADHHAWLRWGLHGPGLAFSPELGLWRLGHDDVQGWATTWFTASNAAVLWFGSKVPALDLPLPAGIRKPTPDLLDLIDKPVWAGGGPNNVGLSFRVERGSAEAAMQRVLAKRLQQSLRYDRGLSYEVSLHYQPVSARDALATVWASCGTGDATKVRDVVITTIKQLQRDGPTSDELAADLDGMRRSSDHPMARQAEGDRRAIQELLGAEPDTTASLEAELAAVTPELGRAAFSRAMARVILTQPGDVAPPVDWPDPYPNLINRSFPGTKYASRADGVIPLGHRFPTLVVGDDGVAMVARDGSALGIAFNEVAAAIQHSTGLLELLHGNGSEVDIQPAWWRGGPKAIERVLAAIPPDRIVRIDDPPGTVPAPPPPSAWTQRRILWLILLVSILFTLVRLMSVDSQRPGVLGPRETIPPGFFESFFPRPT